MSNVTPLEAVQHEPDKDLLAAVEHLLEVVKTGEVVALALVLEYRGSGHATQYVLADGHEIIRLLGGLDYMKHRLLLKLDAENNV